MEQGSELVSTNPQNIYLVVIGTADEGGEFEFSYKHAAGPELIDQAEYEDKNEI